MLCWQPLNKLYKTLSKYIEKEFGTKLVPNSFILVLGTYGAVVEWALTIWEIVRGRK